MLCFVEEVCPLSESHSCIHTFFVVDLLDVQVPYHACLCAAREGENALLGSES
jgi:S-adenosylmethionine/arginine decarboxylase-like enzyme